MVAAAVVAVVATERGEGGGDGGWRLSGGDSALTTVSSGGDSALTTVSSGVESRRTMGRHALPQWLERTGAMLRSGGEDKHAAGSQTI